MSVIKLPSHIFVCLVMYIVVAVVVADADHDDVGVGYRGTRIVGGARGHA